MSGALPVWRVLRRPKQVVPVRWTLRSGVMGPLTTRYVPDEKRSNDRSGLCAQGQVWVGVTIPFHSCAVILILPVCIYGMGFLHWRLGFN